MHDAERLAPEFFRDGGALRLRAGRSRRFGRSQHVALEPFRYVDGHDGLLLAGVAVPLLLVLRLRRVGDAHQRLRRPAVVPEFKQNRATNFTCSMPAYATGKPLRFIHRV
jgi:hypothetical protein